MAILMPTLAGWVSCVQHLVRVQFESETRREAVLSAYTEDVGSGHSLLVRCGAGASRQETPLDAATFCVPLFSHERFLRFRLVE